MLMRKMLVLAVAQAGLGVPGAPVPGANAIQVRTASPSLLNAEYQKRTLLKGNKGNYGTFTVAEHNVIEFECELAQVGAAGTASPLAPLLKGCGFSETISAGVSAVYAPVSTDPTYLTIWCYLDGVLVKLEDAWGTVSCELNPKAIPVAKFRFMGNYKAVTDAAIPGGASFVAFLKPKPLGKTNTPTFTVHGIAVKASAFSWDLANKLDWRALMNFEGVSSVDREPTARVAFELTTVAIKDWAATALANTEAAIQMIHGVGAGNIVQIDMPKFMFTADPAIQDVGGIAFLSGQGSVNPNAGDDEIVLTFK
ncbi:phage tail tube protein [Aquabacterium sp.]|uniref:phage tail tube protein n=1 Tax=Aquabacterium sp. TaxID=1872578 RepID=UPI0025B93DF2|nr:phage tail tube protein [Aquabacterium sp.]